MVLFKTPSAVAESWETAEDRPSTRQPDPRAPPVVTLDYLTGGACRKGSWEEKYTLEMFGLLDCPGCCIPTQTIEKAKKVHKCFGPRTLSLDAQTASAEEKSIAGQMQVKLQGQQGNWTALEDRIDHANKRARRAMMLPSAHSHSSSSCPRLYVGVLSCPLAHDGSTALFSWSFVVACAQV